MRSIDGHHRFAQSRIVQRITDYSTLDQRGINAESINASPRVRALCVSIHDVAPETWPRCRRLLNAIEAVATIPVTLLVVPYYHRHTTTASNQYESDLDRCLRDGSELALHGYTHLDEAPPSTRLREQFRRRIYTLGEGEFSAITVADARTRLEKGLTWFAERGWPVEGFVAPAWLLSDGAWQALREFHFSYTTTLPYFYHLPDERSLFAPSLVYTSRNAAGRFLSQRVNTIARRLLQEVALVRLSLHPADADHPQLLLHVQRLLRQLLVDRTAMTKAAFAHAW